MSVAGALGSSDTDDEVGGTVLRSEIDWFGEPDQPQRGLSHRVGAAMRNRDSTGHAGGELSLTFLERFLQTLPICASASRDQVGHFGDDCMFIAGDRGIEPY